MERGTMPRPTRPKPIVAPFPLIRGRYPCVVRERERERDRVDRYLMSGTGPCVTKESGRFSDPTNLLRFNSCKKW